MAHCHPCATLFKAAWKSNRAKGDSVLDFKLTHPNLALALSGGCIFNSIKSGASALTATTTVWVCLATSNRLEISSHLNLTK
jgi:hypothetical protein